MSPDYKGELDGGFDLYKSFTPNLVGVVSYNMDFAETEADERRINLTRFPMFFPEKRMFFLEGSENFSFSSSISFTPFFSRTVGLYSGTQIPVLFGTKLYGKIGSTNLTFLDVQTRDATVPDGGGGAPLELPGTNLLAARVTQNIFAQSKVGFILTNGSQTGEKNSLLGMDFNYSSSKFLGDKNVMLAAWGVYNWNETEDGRHHGFGFRADYPNDLWNVQSTYAYYGEALDPGMGYMMRQGIQTGFVRVGFQPRPKGGFLGRLVRQFFFDVSADYYWDLSGGLETSTLSASPLGFRTPSGESFSFSVVDNHDLLPFDWTVSDGVVLPAGPVRLHELPAQRQHRVPPAGHLRSGLELRRLLFRRHRQPQPRADAEVQGLRHPGLRRQPCPGPPAGRGFQRERLPGQGRHLPLARPGPDELHPIRRHFQYARLERPPALAALARQRGLPGLYQELGEGLGPPQPAHAAPGPGGRQDLALHPPLTGSNLYLFSFFGRSPGL